MHPTLWNTFVFWDRLTHVQQIRINVVFTHVLSALRNASENVRPHSNRSAAQRNFKTLSSHSLTSNLSLVILCEFLVIHDLLHCLETPHDNSNLSIFVKFIEN